MRLFTFTASKHRSRHSESLTHGDFRSGTLATDAGCERRCERNMFTLYLRSTLTVSLTRLGKNDSEYPTEPESRPHTIDTATVADVASFALLADSLFSGEGETDCVLAGGVHQLECQRKHQRYEKRPPGHARAKPETDRSRDRGDHLDSEGLLMLQAVGGIPETLQGDDVSQERNFGDGRRYLRLAGVPRLSVERMGLTCRRS